ncbi:MAG: Nif3-like dinuclear metal center hexameric protein [Prolixibacteraceae bacterium]|jgi:dinuclear metal center YbgI/SA1388 family protein|nr:Nif3-like dinuclear metal center hexameric protein [Prolixibacteraceae bacterium]
MRIKEITSFIETLAPAAYQESYDNAGLCIGNPDEEAEGILITLDVTEAVIDEAIRLGFNMIVSHHPLIFSGIKKITGKSETERCIRKAIKNDIAIYAAHTNFDSVHGGVNTKICEKLGLKTCRVLSPVEGQLKKLVTFVPTTGLDNVRSALFKAGAGHIGNYDSCGYTVTGTGSFCGDETTNPYVGERGKLHFENETRFETIFPKHLQNRIISALLEAHPYEEVAYDIYPLDNPNPWVGFGMIGELDEAVNEEEFLHSVKNIFGCKVIRHTAFLHEKVKKVAVAGGSGSSFLRAAIVANADAFISGDFKYHQFFEAENKILIADIGHFESEQFTNELFYELLTKKFPTFAVRLSEIKTNPVNYLI